MFYLLGLFVYLTIGIVVLGVVYNIWSMLDPDWKPTLSWMLLNILVWPLVVLKTMLQIMFFLLIKMAGSVKWN